MPFFCRQYIFIVRGHSPNTPLFPLALSLISNEVGITIVSNEEQPLKVLMDISLRVLGNTTFFKFLHEAKALDRTSLTPSMNVTSSRLVKQLKASLSIN